MHYKSQLRVFLGDDAPLKLEEPINQTDFGVTIGPAVEGQDRPRCNGDSRTRNDVALVVSR